MAVPPVTKHRGRSTAIGRTADGGLTRLLRSVGAPALADRLADRTSPDEVVSLTLPVASDDERTGRVAMFTEQGRDTAAQAFAEHGWKGFEEPTPDILVRAVRAFPGTVYDVGANSGVYALLAVEATPQADVVAFEPFPPAVRALRRNIELNEAGSRIHVVEAAVAHQLGEVDLFVPVDTGHLETSASLNGSFKEEIATCLAVPSLTLDHHWRSTGRPEVSLVKIDTETTEHQVLAGAVDLTRSERPIIIYEVLPGADTGAIEAFASDLDMVNIRMTATTTTIDCPIVHDPRGWNQVLVPRERLASFVPLLEQTGLTISSVDADPRAGDARDADPVVVASERHDADAAAGADRVRETEIDPDDLEPEPDEHGRYLMNLSPVEVTAVLAKRAALRSLRALAARVRR